MSVYTVYIIYIGEICTCVEKCGELCINSVEALRR